MHYETELAAEVLDRMVGEIAPNADIKEATPVEFGHHTVYRLVVEMPEAERVCYLKATPKGKSATVKVEARILAILGEHTDIPVPGVYGVVDEQEGIPAPYVLLEAVPGDVRFREELAEISDDVLHHLARSSGRYLAELHSLDAVDAFGFLGCNEPVLHGDRPSGALNSIGVADPVEDWKEWYRESADRELEALEGTRFADLASEVGPVVDTRIDGLEGPFDPVLARIDQSFEQIVIRDGDVQGLLDWEFTIASTPVDDLINVSRSLAGGPYLFAPDMPDKREFVLEAVVDGYEAEGGRSVADQVQANRDCYELVATLRSMVHLEDWYRLFDLDNRIEPAASRLREDLEAQF